MKLCKDCVHFRRGPDLYPDYCVGPHIQRDIVYGTRRMNLPGARHSGGDGLERGATPCRDEGFQWVKREDPPPRKEPVDDLVVLGSVSGKKPFSLWRWLFGSKKTRKD